MKVTKESVPWLRDETTRRSRRLACVADAFDQERKNDLASITSLRAELDRINTECVKLKDTNSQLTRKLSASLKNKVLLVTLHFNICKCLNGHAVYI